MHIQSVKARLALIRPSVQQLPAQNPLVEFTFRGGRECMCARGKPQVFCFFLNKGNNQKFISPDKRQWFPASMKLCVK